MTTLTQTPPAGRPEHRFTVEEYLRMVEVGILTKNDKVELIAGRIVEKMPGNPPHEAALHRLHELLANVCKPEWSVRVESLIKLSDSAPEPDLMVIRGPIDRYDFELPRSQDACIVVEVSDTTLRDDRQEKLSVYAAARIPIYWIVNLIDRRLERYSEPTGPEQLPTYKTRQDFAESESISLQIPDRPATTLRVSEMLPRPKP